MDKKNSIDWEKVKKQLNKSSAFLLKFKDLKEPILTSKWEPVFKKHLQIIYMVGLFILSVSGAVSILRIPNFTAMLGGLISVFVVFVVFRLLCEMLAKDSSKK